ncbi:MAG: hypothetical protein IM669_10165 [Phenylobacterium sp.]|jgi:hypothetical protein|uniref:hypothetical protein n=1 Tax=Phenylobacterium sp. TaxID=1871053 RepID=UPI00217870BD|nr:hypothetical protein [Phenylobacterium sp.]MCA3260082.1 hypothetical protein [Rubrivivax sp.]MCA3757873.1 hypothetical protein [Phenylobacterium sp.]
MTSVAQQNAERFLAGRGLTLEDLKRFAPSLGRDECLLLVGPVTEGLANATSDIDLYYFGDGDLVGDSTLQLDDTGVLDVTFDDLGNEINVERWTPSSLQHVCRLMASSMEVLDAPQNSHGNAIEQDPRRLKMVHRVRNAVPLANPAVFERWRAAMHCERLHEHLSLLALLEYLALREDVFGELLDGEVESASWIARTMVAPSAIAALLHAAGLTNPSVKWHLKLLRRHQTDIGTDLVAHLIDFAAEGRDPDAAAIVRSFDEVLDPAASAVQSRLKAVRRAALAFGQTVRYTSTYRQAKKRVLKQLGGGLAVPVVA